MKKFICLLAAMTMFASTSVFAEYDKDTNTYTLDSIEAGYSTVKIEGKGGDIDGEIFYVNQTDENEYQAAATFLMKGDAVPGNYVLTMGGEGKPAKTVNFTIEEDPKKYVAKEALETVANGTTGSKAFILNKSVTADALADNTKLAITVTDSVQGTATAIIDFDPGVTGGSSVVFGLIINDVPDTVTNMTVSLGVEE